MAKTGKGCYYSKEQMEAAIAMMEKAQNMMKAYKFEASRARIMLDVADDLTGGCFASLVGLTKENEPVNNLVKNWKQVAYLVIPQDCGKVAEFLQAALPEYKIPTEPGWHEVNQ